MEWLSTKEVSSCTVLDRRDSHGKKKGQGECNPSIPPGKESILFHIQAIVDTWKSRTALKIHSRLHPRVGFLRSLFDNINRNEITRRQETFVDRGINHTQRWLQVESAGACRVLFLAL